MTLQTHPSSSEVVFTHGGKVSDHGGITVEKFVEDAKGDRVSVGFAIYSPGSKTGDEPVTHTGSEFLLMLEGSIVAEVNGKQYRMEPGDTLRFPATQPHRGWNPGEITARALFVNF